MSFLFPRRRLIPFPDRIYTKALLRTDALPNRRESRHLLTELALLSRGQRRAVIRLLPAPVVRALADEWWWRAHGGQEEPEAGGDGTPWNVWAIVAGRGFGKTRAGAEWVWARAREDGSARIALVGATIDEVERVMVTGESGLLACARGHERALWRANKGILHFPSGAEAHAFSAERPEKLRGPQHHHAWCDELAKWPSGRGGGHSHAGGARESKADSAWNNLMLGLRLGERPRAIVTTTPKPAPLLRRVLDLPGCAVTRGRTAENPHLPGTFRSAVEAMFGGTRLGRQELDGILLEEFEGALWTRALIESARDPASAAAQEHERVVVGVDPPASSHGDACGIIVCARDREGVCRVVGDHSARGFSPEGWARRVCQAAELHGAGRVVAEKNMGGELIASNLRAVDANLPVDLVHAGPSKAARAEPIALRFETGRARLAGHFPDLEDQLCALTWSGYQGPGSPDRVDAMVWAMTELFKKPRPDPRISSL
ncbi:MAG TPA: terminase family protein [Allosphingosinicella sp.]|nr:terminase family protein [Allosphingosinicella sp.]